MKKNLTPLFEYILTGVIVFSCTYVFALGSISRGAVTFSNGARILPSTGKGIYFDADVSVNGSGNLADVAKNISGVWVGFVAPFVGKPYEPASTMILNNVEEILSLDNTTVLHTYDYTDEWLFCDGRLLDTKNHKLLSAAIHNEWNIATAEETFYLPDLRNRYLRALDSFPANQDPTTLVTAPVAVDRDPDLNRYQAPSHTGETNFGVGSYQSAAILSHIHTTAASQNDNTSNTNPSTHSHSLVLDNSRSPAGSADTGPAYWSTTQTYGAFLGDHTATVYNVGSSNNGTVSGGSGYNTAYGGVATSITSTTSEDVGDGMPHTHSYSNYTAALSNVSVIPTLNQQMRPKSAKVYYYIKR